MPDSRGHEHCPGCGSPHPEPHRSGEPGGDPAVAAAGGHGRLSRRAALRLGAAASGALAVAPFVARGSSLVPAAELGAALPVATQQLDWPVPRIVTRAQWGADERLRKGSPSYDATVEKLIVHHTATPNGVSDWSRVMRGIYSYAVSGEYIDVPYHWLIDPAGRIYEGRWARDYPAGVPHTGENGARENVRGGHALAHNSRTIGIAFMGTYTYDAPSSLAIEALVSLAAWKCARWGIDPRGATPYRDANGSVKVLPNICGHRDTRQTTCPGRPLLDLLPSIRRRVANRLLSGRTGYWIASADGRVAAFGDMPDHGDARRSGLGPTIAAIAAHRSGRGYWLAAPDGAVYSFGSARYYGGMAGRRLNAPIVGMAAHPSGEGYWLVGADGGIFSFGAARFHGSTGALRLRRPVVGMCPTPTGKGYWLFAGDGGVFSFGNAHFYGSTGGMQLQQPIVAMASTRLGKGYWLFARDGGVFTFGAARFRGSAASRRLAASVVDAVATTSGRGYLMLMANGGIMAFGDAPNFGSAAGRFTNAIGLAGKVEPKA